MAKRAASGEVLVLPAGASVQSVAVARSWHTRREKYGDRGASPDAADRQARTARRRAQQRRQTHCQRGHRLTDDNVLVYANGRMCRACNLERARRRRGLRPQWAQVGTARVNVEVHDARCVEEGRALWQAMTSAHPDAGGSHRQFIEARQRWQRFLARETAWYKAVGLDMPDLKARR
jgi:hypothetical protein